jgi:oxygen-independent coproporphyrinogen-3 oxidase
MSAPGLYIHIPFCRSKCNYCSFYSTTSLDLLPAFLGALLQEMDTYQTNFHGFETVYIGGGTPSLLSVKDLEAILVGAAKKFSIDSRSEITLEANPADIDLSNLKALRRLGINRLNIGVQSFDENVLNFLGRRHNRRQAISALTAVERAGFDNTGLDLIYGVPGHETASWTDTLRLALSFNPAHLSCYQLTVEPGTPLSIRQTKGEISLPDEETLADLFFQASDIIQKAGYIHYEVSNFARNVELESRHNKKYWDHTPYLGLGPAAHSFDGRRRWWNHTSVPAYIKDLENRMPPVAASEKLTDEQLRLEAVFLGLRTKSGFHLRDYKRRYGYDLLLEKAETISQLTENGLVEIKNGCLKPTLAGMAVADSLTFIVGTDLKSAPTP